MESSTSSSAAASWRGRARGRGWRGRGWWKGRGRGGHGAGSSAGLGPRKSWQKRSGQNEGGPMGGGSGGSRQPCLVQRTLAIGPYPSWAKYFPDEAYSSSSTTAVQMKAFEAYFKQHLEEYSLDDVGYTWSLPVDATTMLQDSSLASALPNLSEQLRNQPERILNAMALAFHTVLLSPQVEMSAGNSDEGGAGPAAGTERGGAGSAAGTERGGAGSAASSEGGQAEAEDIDPQVSYTLPRLYIRLYNFGPVIPLKSIKAPLYGKCVSIQGTVVRVSNIKPLVTTLAFSCSACQGTQAVLLPDGKYTQPTKCSSAECRGKVFVALRSSPLTETVDWQTIKVQELSADDGRESGRIPRTVECELTSDLVDSCVPGDMVTVTGIVKATSAEDAGRGRNAKDKCIFLLYLQAISVSNSKGAGSAADPSSHGLHMEFTTKDYYAISEIHSDKNVFKLVVGSLCPAIYGHEMVKAGLVLGLFGGSQRYADFQNTIPVRGDPHILVVGDPGLGKSQMLQATSNIAPRGVYVCGNTTTTSGLTVTLVKEGGSGDFALEAGALVLADQGCCCIDEFDKMGHQHQALLEAMEQQSISIAKAGVVCSLPARTSIMAAANPIGGHYNKGKTVSENLKMSSALLSRFDLVFILLDRPDEEMDSLLSEHVLSLHARGRRGQGQPSAAARAGHRSGAGQRGAATFQARGDGTGILTATARRNAEGKVETSMNHSSSLLLMGDETGDPFQQRLKVRPGEDFDPIPCQLLRKYVGYARKYVHPRLGTEAADVLQKFYLDLRKQRRHTDSTPITTRQLESLIRLTEARARVELREEATAQDARDVVEVMKFSMHDTFSDQYGMLDFDRSQHGSGMSQRAQGKRLISELNRVADHNGSSMFTVAQMKDIAKRIGLQVGHFEDVVYSLNNQNYLLKKGPKLYQLQTASCL